MIAVLSGQGLLCGRDRVAAIACGKNKTSAIIGALKTELSNGLIPDDQIAAAVAKATIK
jgi:DNA-binding transcriptional regulator LsrR (DeoR family)